MKNITTFFVLLALATAIVAILVWGVGKQEKLECLKWQKEAGQYQGYFLADWQKKQCEFYRIEVK